jgi:D-3-phosphoglycerate dehydrogenase
MLEEVADHVMLFLLAIFLVTMDRCVRAGRWREGWPLLSQFPRLLGQMFEDGWVRVA